MTHRAIKTSNAVRPRPAIDRPPLADDVPFTARLPDGRTLFVLVPHRMCERDVSGEVAFLPEGIRFLDRVQALAMRTPMAPTPGFVLTLREALGLTQAGLAARIGVDKLTVSRWERGVVSPGVAAARALDRLRRAMGSRGVVVAA